MQMRIIEVLKTLKPLAIHPGKPQDMSQQRALRIKPPPLHHHTDAVQRQLLQPATLLRFNLSRQPDEAFVLPELFLEFLASNVEHWRKMTSHRGRVLKRRRDTEHRWDLYIHRKHFAMSIRYHAS